jgi:hypothetical protein
MKYYIDNSITFFEFINTFHVPNQFLRGVGLCRAIRNANDPVFWKPYSCMVGYIFRNR